MQLRFLILLATLFLNACAMSQKLPPEISKIQSEPGIETIVIAGTNDIHGALAPHQLKTREAAGKTSIDYEAGGAAYLASYMRILHEQFGTRFLWLDGGDEFQGSIESNSEKGAPLIQFFNATGLSAAAIGNHEFDFGPEGNSQDTLGTLKARMKEAHFPYLASNIVDRKTGKPAEFPGSGPSKIFLAGGVKVGVIGLSTLDTPRTTRAEYVASLQFTDLRQATLRESKALRDQGAEVIVIVSHVGLKCERGRGLQGLALRKPSDPQGSCEDAGEMVRLLRSLPEGTVDAVVAGHSHQIVHHWINGIPVIQSGAYGRYFSLIYIPFDKVRKKVLSERIRIEGPIPVCSRVFANQQDCNGDRPAPPEGRGSLSAPYFHGTRISADSTASAVLRPTFEKSAQIKSAVVGHAERSIEHERFSESPLGNLVADSIREAGKADFALVNAGGIRAPINEGEITYEEVFRTLPFDNSVSLLKMTGRQVRNLIRVAESGSRGFPSVSGLRLTLIDPALDAPSSDLNGDRRIEPWEINRILEIQAVSSDGKSSSLKDDRIYSLATLDFLVSGGDDLAWPMSQIPESRIQLSTGEVMRDAFAKYITQHQPLNTAERPALDPKNPRIKFGKPSAKRGRRSPRKR